MKIEDIIGMLTLYTFAAVAVVFPLYVIIRSVINFAHAKDGRASIILKAFVVLVIWGLLSLVFVFLPIMYLFEPGEGVDRDTANHRITVLTIVLTLIYIAVGLAMAYWVRLQPGWKTMGKTNSGI
ncbi:MAG TPA: hypothetical protein VJS44_02435 [Pyrinomonadaceae bacterium]|nr:hypothetical protein [Pyrinomonadaceae bacterium]